MKKGNRDTNYFLLVIIGISIVLFINWYWKRSNVEFDVDVTVVNETTKDFTPHITNALATLKASTGVDFERYRGDLVKYTKSLGNKLDDQTDSDIVNRLYGFLLGISGVVIKKGALTKIDGSSKNIDDTVKELITNAIKKMLKTKPEDLDSTPVKDLRKTAIEYYTYTGFDFKSKDDMSDVVYGYLKGSLIRLKVLENN